MSEIDGFARIDGWDGPGGPVLRHHPGSPERARLEARLRELAAADTPLTMSVGGVRRLGRGERIAVVQPHHHSARLGVLGNATVEDVDAVVAGALKAAPVWQSLSFDDRAAVFLRAAELLTGPWRETVVAATMLGQSKAAQQAEADVVGGLVDAWRRDVRAARRVLAEQTPSAPGVWSRTDHRPLPGFVCAISPFGSTAVAGRLPTAPALMGNTVVWKPAPTQTLSAWHLLRVLEAAGLPPGVITMVTGDGQAVAEAALAHPALAGVHFSGSAATFQALWLQVGRHLDRYAACPRLVGETAERGFLLAHPSADPALLKAALVRGAFAYQGQDCSAVARAYLPRSVWQAMKGDFLDEVRSLPVGDVSDVSNFMGAVIDAPAHDRIAGAIARAREVHSLDLVVGGHTDDAIGWFVEPTVITGTDPRQKLFQTDLFGPVLAVHVYDDARWAQTLDLVGATVPGVRTGRVVAEDRLAIAAALGGLRHAAEQLLINDTPPTAAGNPERDLARWTDARSISEALASM
ncbi:aldehyde dehydrogenase family protein [Streptacidiphilus jiangxiensis]|uniref:L-glutamate gamma-semialdehyde dehydrogenase n=1 Tax=Streptacidiphilus jiangxiensis TaxID=235985 RepID=A0A1H7RQ45_STRJI|nr:aldehyde dehydrogenase family protein [Streptacidiphilus jiangxiensis]SEL62285.1 1-pyrroline-5-carboxylate dehydrogenase [Streptacidiphilus jiangxiensis]